MQEKQFLQLVTFICIITVSIFMAWLLRFMLVSTSTAFPETFAANKYSQNFE